MVALIMILSGISVLLSFTYLIIAHYVLVIEISDDIKKTPSDVKLLPFDPNKQL